MFPPSNIMLFDMQRRLIGGGELDRVSLNQIILKRIILTGYANKVNRRKAIVKYLFFNPDDVKYFKPAELRTKAGLKGKILESVGTHGMMKCFFNNLVQQNDTICLTLYKRVYPKLPKINASN